MLTNIAIEKLHPHPENPRKDLGDISELAASIKEQGIFQNLTVVKEISEITKRPIEQSPNSTTPYEQEYTVIIGHRRLAAAKEAGLTEVPCAIVEMDYPAQLSTMLLENMQRQDLTIIEQAQGIQLLLDLGESVKTVSEKTGLSESTIYKRKKIMELDRSEAKEAFERGATLEDFAALNVIKDEKKKNELLKHIGTNNFKYKLSEAERSQTHEELLDKIRAVVGNRLEERTPGLRLTYLYEYKTVNDLMEWLDEFGAEGTIWYTKSYNATINIYKEAVEVTETPEEAERRVKKEKLTEAKGELLAMEAKCQELRYNFVKSLPETKIKKHIREIIQLALRQSSPYYGSVTDLLGIYGMDISELKLKKIEGEELEALKESAIESNPERIYLYQTYLGFEKYDHRYGSVWGEYAGNEDMDNLYDALVMLGYQIADEEQQIKDGTHPIYQKIKEIQE